MKVEVKMSRFDGPARSCFFPRLAGGSLAVRHQSFRSTLGKSPLISAVGVDEEKFDCRFPSAITHRGHLDRQSESWNSGRTHVRNLALVILPPQYFTNMNVQQKLCSPGLRMGYERECISMTVQAPAENDDKTCRECGEKATALGRSGMEPKLLPVAARACAWWSGSSK